MAGRLEEQISGIVLRIKPPAAGEEVPAEVDKIGGLALKMQSEKMSRKQALTRPE